MIHHDTCIGGDGTPPPLPTTLPTNETQRDAHFQFAPFFFSWCTASTRRLPKVAAAWPDPIWEAMMQRRLLPTKKRKVS